MKLTPSAVARRAIQALSDAGVTRPISMGAAWDEESPTMLILTYQRLFLVVRLDPNALDEDLDEFGRRYLAPIVSVLMTAKAGPAPKAAMAHTFWAHETLG